MSKDAVCRPLGEAHLSDEFRPHPVRRFVLRRQRPERRRLRLEGLQQSHDLLELAAVEARADVAGVFELVAVIHAENERAEVRSRVSRLAPSGDDKFLLVYELELSPVRGSLAGQVSRRGDLRDEAFPAVLGRALVQRAAVAIRDLAETKDRRAGVAEDALESLAALDEWEPAKIRRAGAQQVERDERRAGAAGVAGTALQMNAALKALKSRRLTFRIERDDLAVEDERLLQPLRPCANSAGDLGELAGFFVAEARPQVDAGAFRRDLGNRANAVVLRLVYEARIGQRRVDERREHRLSDRGSRHPLIITAMTSGLFRLRASRRSRRRGRRRAPGSGDRRGHGCPHHSAWAARRSPRGLWHRRWVFSRSRACGELVGMRQIFSP